jgi:hypothetical protein
VNLNPVLYLKLPQRFPCERLGHLLHELVPGDCLRPIVQPDHGNTFLDRANDKTQPASHTVVLPDFGLILSVVRNKIDALMGPFIAGDVAQIALNTF